MRNPLYHVRLNSADVTIKCHGDYCDREISGIHKGDAEQLGEILEQIESDNGWCDGLCSECYESQQIEENKQSKSEFWRDFIPVEIDA